MAHHARVLILVFTLFPALAGAQPAPIGPPRASAGATGELSVSVLTSIVRGRAQMTVDDTNARLRQEGKSTRVSIESLTARRPLRSQTVFENRPNSFYTGVPYALEIKVAIPLSFDRHIHIPIDLQVFCDDWHTHNGHVTVRSVPAPASIEGGNIIEDVLHVRDLIDSRVRGSFNAPLPVTVPLSAQCSTIGSFDGGTATVDDDTVKWDVPRSPRPVSVPSVNQPTIVVTFDRLKRLRARRLPGNTILYNEVEQFALRAFGNYTEAFKQLTMREDDDVALALPPIRLDARTFDSLVVIGNIDQPPNNPKDSAFSVATRAQNYGPGTHVLQIPKTYSVLNSTTHKPQFFSVPAYELSYTVRFQPGVASPVR